MSITFNADEIFEMAEEIERNGASFYRQAAQNTADQATKELLLNMAVMEDGHLEIFQQMRKDLTDADKKATTYDPENQAVLYLQTMADARGYEGKISPQKELTGQETPRQIIEIALNSEKESVVFYYGLKGLTSASTEKKLDKVIIEELGHITSLLKKLKEYEN
ncbi:MAG: ferritin family protein [Planctomycetes bacterium]|nr:ferritin family protein [Planctomycetota bacterium]